MFSTWISLREFPRRRWPQPSQDPESCAPGWRGERRQSFLQIARGGDAGDARRARRGADDRIGHRFGRQRANRRHVDVTAPAAGREREDRVAVGGRVDRHDRTRIAVVRHLRDLRRLRFRERRVGGDDADRGVRADPGARLRA